MAKFVKNEFRKIVTVRCCERKRKDPNIFFSFPWQFVMLRIQIRNVLFKSENKLSIHSVSCR